MSDNIAALVLAAGYSSRMGEFKPLLDLAGMTALERAVNLFRSAGVQDVRVVTGHRAAELSPLLERLGVREIPSPHYADGMFASVVAGVESVDEEEVEAFFVLPVDLPLVRPATVGRLVKSYHEEGGAIVCPSFLGERGHPPLIAGWLAPEIARWRGACGLQGILLEWEGVAREVEVADEQILRDMDTPDDYRLLREKSRTLQVPSETECRLLLKEVFRVDPPILSHGEAVAQVAVLLGSELNRAGCELDLPLLAAAGLLHDVARQEPNHAGAGAGLLRGLGYEAVADLVASHMDISVSDGEPVGAREVVYLADKMVQGERRVPLAERFGAKMARHADNPALLKKISARLENAVMIQSRLEAVLGRPVAEVTGT